MTVVLAAHGSPDPRHAAVIEAIRVGVSAHQGDVRLGWLGHHSPELSAVVTEALRDDPATVVVPLLLAPAFHARVDVPAGSGVARVAEVLAPDPRLLDLLDVRLAEALSPSAPGPVQGLVLAAAGSTDHAADVLVRGVAEAWAERTRVPVEVGYAAAEPSVTDALVALRARGLDRIAVGSFFLAPGRLHDAVVLEAAGADVLTVAAPLGAHPFLIDVVCDRAQTALDSS